MPSEPPAFKRLAMDLEPVINLDNRIGRDFEVGLANLKELTEK
jgi:hypothetical protein